ncbi:MAG: ABC transporter ATP-binding protein [Chloroflexi bacterium]|nr:ABC transporter ATP-binding protein [Chloroflexota bacterium]
MEQRVNKAAGNSYVIEVENLVKRYDDLTAVNGISFNVRRGEVFGLLGPNGAGKTTTVEILEGMRKADSGTAFIDGIDVGRQPKRVKSIIGVQLQSAQFFDHLKLTEIVSLFGTLYGKKVDANDLLERVNLEEKAGSYYAPLSGGQKQRLSIAVALVNDPVVLFLDEPTTGLDPQARRHMWQLIKSIQDEGTTVVLTTHYMEEAEELCDRVAVMDSGSIIRMDTPDTLVEELLATGFTHDRQPKLANLEDVFISLTGRSLRDE